jgi:hypothetical protein
LFDRKYIIQKRSGREGTKIVSFSEHTTLRSHKNAKNFNDVMGEKPDLAISKPIQSDDAIELNGYDNDQFI